MTAEHRSLLLSGLVTVLFLLPDPADTCGPWFPETILKTAYAAIQPPRPSLEIELEKIELDIELPGGLVVPAAMPPRARFDHSRPDPREAIEQVLAADPGDLLGNEEGIRDRLLDSPSELARDVSELALVLWNRNREKTVFDRKSAETVLLEYRDIRAGMFGVKKDPVLPPIIQGRAWPITIPEEFSLYLDGAAAFREEKYDEARNHFQKLLALPPEERKHRSIWAVYLLGRIDLAEGDDGLVKSIHHFRKVLDLWEEGFHDSLSMRWDALKCLADHERYRPGHDPIRVMKTYFALARAGQPYCLRELKTMAREIEFSVAAKDPVLRQIVTAVQLSQRSEIRYWEPENPDADETEEAWLAALEKEKVAGDEANRLAWLAYKNGRFDLARRWLRLAPTKDETGCWVEAKLALRDGSPSRARSWLNRAAPGFPRSRSFDAPVFLEESDHELTHRDLREYQVSQFWGDRGLVRLATDDFTGALDALMRSGYWYDAAFVAEQLLSRDELLSYVRRHYGSPFPEIERTGYFHWDQGRIQNNLRYLTARRLARDRFFRDARAFYPEEIRPVFDHYVTLYRKFRNRNLGDEERGAAGWELAQLHRSLGMELFGTEVGPDWFALHRGNFSLGSYGSTRYDVTPDARRKRLRPGDYRNPVAGSAEEPDWLTDSYLGTGKQIDPTPSERWRFRHYAGLRHVHRFHYRHVASDLAWEASRFFPDNDARTADLLNTAGRWISVRHPEAADLFYKSLVNRNRNTLVGVEADTRRWFVPSGWDFDPWAAAGVEEPQR